MPPSKTMLAALFLLASVCCVMSSKILLLVQMPSQSHYILGRGMADILTARGHEVTYVTSFPSKNPVCREIPAERPSLFDDDSVIGMSTAKESKWKIMITMVPILRQLTDMTLSSPRVQELMSNKSETFDLVIIEHFMNEALIGLGVKYNCPVLIASSVALMNPLARLTGNPTSPATIPNVLLGAVEEMGLLQRVGNTCLWIFQELQSVFLYNPDQKALYQKHFPEEASKVPFEELYKKVAMTLTNSHPSIGYPRPLLPNTVEVGGYHIAEIKPLPKDLQKILDNAKNGVIYFSMGSFLRSARFPEEERTAIMQSFAKLNQTILWKFEEDLPGAPENVIIRSWMPQTSILAHHNVKLFISHGGLLSCTEAAAAGVPLLAIPIFGDQHYNAKMTMQRGHGLVLDFEELTEEALTYNLQEILNNPSYGEVAKRVRNLYHDRPMTPRELVAFYSEHVIRTGGAPHLTAPHLSLYKSLLLDVAFILAIPTLLLAAIPYFLCRKLFCKKKTDKKSDKKLKKN